MINVEKLYINSSRLIFLLYLPITFFVWYWMLAGGAGGITTILSVVALLFTIFFMKYQKIDFNFTLFFMFITYCFLYVLIYYVFCGDMLDSSNRGLFSYHILAISMYVISYVFGRNFALPDKKILMIIFLSMVLKVFLSADLSVLSIDLSSVDDNLKGLYLGLSDIFCIFSIILIATIKKHWVKFFVLLLSIFALFVLNSRSSLYIYIFTCFLYFILFFRVSEIFLIFATISLGGIIFSPKLTWVFSENSRMFSILSFDGSDQSAQERLTLGEQGLRQIADNIILGDYGGVIKLHNDLGAYIHNILSYWQTYGVVAFLLCIYFFIFQSLKSAFIAYRLKFRSDYHYIFLLCIYLVLTILFTKSYIWYFAWFVLGLIHNFLNLKEIRF